MKDRNIASKKFQKRQQKKKEDDRRSKEQLEREMSLMDKIIGTIHDAPAAVDENKTSPQGQGVE